ncbi:GlxA family transcriptional regulator [Tateyamaria omphalii]|uniref:GlxA family transcriptional regulator n=1 Tax=Tateyamaria omphalii TaxID=299262 RepID=UPI001C999E15|nr:GlxA family transcriptional regulator [Tateyamaria omphalii]MBY5932017.1 GlxA family transcriptional regulator [Tateyamaria omphalii]
MTEIAILVLQNTNMLSLATAVDPLRAANRQAGSDLYTWEFLTPNAAPVELTSGLVVPANPIHRLPSCDVLILVAGFDPAAQTSPRLIASLKRLTKDNTTLLAIDGGAWLAAKAGLLDTHKATTHWEDLQIFAETFPDITVENARYVVSGERWTSGGAAPALDMMLHLIGQRHGPQLAAKVAAGFIHMTQATPSDPQIRHHPTADHNAVTARAHAIMEAHLDAPLFIPDIAARLGLSPRRLQQHFQSQFSHSPKAHYASLRLSEAHRLITTTRQDLHSIALTTGFTSQSSLSRAHKAHYGQSPRATRNALHFAQ